MKKLYILGTHPYIDNVKFGLKNTEYWGVSPLLMTPDSKYEDKLDLVFEIHRKDEYIQDTAEYIYKTDLPVVMQKKDKKVKNCIVYPFQKYFRKYGKYVTNSITLMLWHAVELGYKDIIIAGVEFLADREGTIERPNVEYWTGYFRAKGIKIESLKESYLFKTKYVYGIDNILLMIKRHKERVEELIEMKGNYFMQYCENAEKYYGVLNDDYTHKKNFLIESMKAINYCIQEQEVLMRMI